MDEVGLEFLEGLILGRGQLDEPDRQRICERREVDFFQCSE